MKFLVYGLSNGWGGVEAIVMGMVSRLCNDHCFDILLSEGDCNYANRYANKSIRFLHVPAWGSDRRGFKSGIINILKQASYDYVWINACLMSNRDIISVVKKHSSAKIITHSHGSSFEEDNQVKRMILMGMHYLNRSYYHHHTDYPCMCSRKSGEWYYGKSYMNTHDVYYIKNGVDVSRYSFKEDVRSEYRNQLGLTDELALFHAGRLTYVKNQRFILDICAEMKKRGKNFKLFIAGEGELYTELVDYASMIGINDEVVFLGNRSDVDKLYQAMDVFLLPSHHEGFPVTLAEAQASGIYCIVSDHVSEETNLTGSVNYLPIDKGVKPWADLISGYTISSQSRVEMADAVINSGYDINDVCKQFVKHISKS